MALSRTSNTMWCKPVPSFVSPIYIPGRLRTASSPFKTLMLSEVYSLIGGFLIFGLFHVKHKRLLNTHRYDDITEFLVFRCRHQDAAVRIAERESGSAAADVVQPIHQVVDVEADIQWLAVVVGLDFFLRLFLLAIAADNAEVFFSQHKTHAPEFFIGQYCGALQSLLHYSPLHIEVIVVFRYDALVIRKFSFDYFRYQGDTGKSNFNLLLRKFQFDTFIAIRQQFG